jgi:hypothetical protein
MFTWSIIYINDISDHLFSLVRLFADDTSLSYSSTNLLQIERKLNSDMNILFLSRDIHILWNISINWCTVEHPGTKPDWYMFGE